MGRAVINANVLAKRVAAHPWNDEGKEIKDPLLAVSGVCECLLCGELLD